jgi:sigma-B regulation protein RsbU (phosphoserine phosphatase)
MAVGILEDARWEQETVRLAPGDMLVLYSDGLTEAQDSEERFFGEKRLLSAARAGLGCPAQDVRDLLISRMNEFTAGTPQFDDVTVVVVVHEPDSPSS